MHPTATVWGFSKLGVPFLGGPHDKDYRALGFILGGDAAQESGNSL